MVISRIYTSESNFKALKKALLIDGTDSAEFGKVCPMPKRTPKDLLKWAREHWGSDGNAGKTAVNEEEHYVEFRTEGDCPRRLIVKLSEKLPKAKFGVIYASKDIGRNAGYILIHNGVQDGGKKIEDESDLAVSVGEKLWGLCSQPNDLSEKTR